MIKMGVAGFDALARMGKVHLRLEDLRPARFSPPEMADADSKIMHVLDPLGVLLIFVER